MIEIPDLEKENSLVKTGANFQQIKSIQGDGACLHSSALSEHNGSL